ncbi:hypothetical protein OHS33_02140 [Streptomyces sp. NBC_00536]|uniref:hypothetical protein n=1 Tax=Streptomyces sp. NBC_00536 TaxID=2975769 RepID=UPI002E81F2FA|nr:hypothetical protein [Streptomyces sp. NBC_00536]WUC77254.1 hypothetical protein OHS33_02140 [Streptomyces sp. NBC_00536]
MAHGDSGGFEPATGDGPAPTGGPAAAKARAAEVRTAYEGLLTMRRILGGGSAAAEGPDAVPAPWERQRMPRAVALVLEAAGFAPSALDAAGGRTATGYRVRPGEAPERVEVTWVGPPGGGAAGAEEERLTACAETLGRHGWECLLYRGPRRRRFLEVEPRH